MASARVRVCMFCAHVGSSSYVLVCVGAGGGVAPSGEPPTPRPRDPGVNRAGRRIYDRDRCGIHVHSADAGADGAHVPHGGCPGARVVLGAVHGPVGALRGARTRTTARKG